MYINSVLWFSIIYLQVHISIILFIGTHKAPYLGR